MTTNNELNLPLNYSRNPSPDYYVDAPPSGQIWQPDVYEYAYYLCKTIGIKNIIDIGSGNGKKLIPFLESGVNVHTVDYGSNLQTIINNFPSNKNLFPHEVNLDSTPIEINTQVIQDSLIICSDVIEHLQNPQLLIRWLARVQNFASIILLSTPDRDRIRGYGSLVAPENPYHIQEWTLTELLLLLKRHGVDKTIYGHTVENNLYPQKSTSIIIFGKTPSLLFPEKCEATPTYSVKLCVDSKDKYTDQHIEFWRRQHLILQGIPSPVSKDMETSKKSIYSSITTLASEYFYSTTYINSKYIPLGYIFEELERGGYSEVRLTKQFLYKDRYSIERKPYTITFNKNQGKLYPLPLIQTIPTNDSKLKTINSLYNRSDDVLEILNPSLDPSIYRQSFE